MNQLFGLQHRGVWNDVLYDSSPNKHRGQVFEVNLIQKPVPCDFKLLLIPTCFPASQLDYRKLPSFSCTF